MTDARKSITILMADDDPDDRLLTKKALDAAKLTNDFRSVCDGEELLDYLRRQNGFADESKAPRPGLILLDLNMPRMDGREALAEIKQDMELKRIPVVILTTSKAEEDVIETYDLGANSYIRKPVTFQGLVDVLKTTHAYWFEVVESCEEAEA